MEKFEFKNRNPINANRRKIKIISQTANEIIADVELADGATEQGTSISAEKLTSWQNQIETNETVANNANTKSDNAVDSATKAEQNSINAQQVANTAKTIAETAKTTADNAKATADDALQRAVDGLGTKIFENEALLPTWNANTKVNVLDIVDNLTSDCISQPLSANQGHQLKTICENLKTEIDNYWKLIYPIDSIYISFNNKNPEGIFGGKWNPLPSGKTLWTIPADETELSEGDGLGGGKTINAGLPNITGELNCYANNDTDHELGWCGGAITGKASDKNYSDNTRNTHGNAFSGFNFNASRQADGNNPNGIYGNSTTVQPPAIKIYAWVRTE